jgi:hypothetical protein
MEAYERWFEQNGEPGQRQLAALRLLGFFDRPASRECLDVLRKGVPIPGLTEPLQDLSDAEWNSTLTTLAEDHRLIAITRRHGRIRPQPPTTARYTLPTRTPQSHRPGPRATAD